MSKPRLNIPCGISWCDATWNPCAGCSPISEGCENCYAATMAARMGKMPDHAEKYGPLTKNGHWTGEIALFPERLQAPLQRKAPATIFVGSMTDLFHPNVPMDFINRVFGVMHQAKQHKFMVLTKRPKRMHDANLSWPSNVWAGVTAEDQENAEKRLPHLFNCSAENLFVSIEPMLGPVDLSRYLNDELGYVIVGGESGPNVRPMHPDWVRSVRDQCEAAGVPFHFKQWGNGGRPLFAGYDLKKRNGGHTLDGKEHMEVV